MSVTQLPERTTYQPPGLHRPVFTPESSEPSPPAEASPAAEWSVAKQIGFRFAFGYFVLYLLPFPISVIPGS